MVLFHTFASKTNNYEEKDLIRFHISTTVSYPEANSNTETAYALKNLTQYYLKKKTNYFY